MEIELVKLRVQQKPQDESTVINRKVCKRTTENSKAPSAKMAITLINRD